MYVLYLCSMQGFFEDNDRRANSKHKLWQWKGGGGGRCVCMWYPIDAGEVRGYSYLAARLRYHAPCMHLNCLNLKVCDSCNT